MAKSPFTLHQSTNLFFRPFQSFLNASLLLMQIKLIQTVIAIKSVGKASDLWWSLLWIALLTVGAKPESLQFVGSVERIHPL